MMEVKLNKKYYIVTILMAALVIFVWYGIYFLNTNQLMIEDDPMTDNEKITFTIMFTAVAVIWTLSFIIMVRQIFLGYAFSMDIDGIHNTLNCTMLFAFIFVSPIRRIPFSAITGVSKRDGHLVVSIDKSQVAVLPIFRPFIRCEYHFFQGFCQADMAAVETFLNNRISKTLCMTQ